jgi:alpha-L-fucosidase
MYTSMKKLVPLYVLSCLFALLTAGSSAHAQRMIEIRPDWNTTMDNRMEWWHEARYGMFIHWGPDALPHQKGAEFVGTRIPPHLDEGWRNYEDLLKLGLVFNPIDFNAKEWVDIARNAGMKYIVYVTKHHNGFVMYDSKYTDFDIVDYTPFDRDPLKELADACLDAGIRLGVYYSVPDKHHPEFPPKWYRNLHYDPNPDANLDLYVEFMENQIRELLTNYGQIDVLFFDDGGAFDSEVVSFPQERAELLHAIEGMKMIRSIQPDIIINDRYAHGTMDYLSAEDSYPELGDFMTLHNFETNATLYIDPDGTWMYDKRKIGWITGETVIHNLAHMASMGGNYLLNVGPTAEGVIPKWSVDILLEAGDWLKKYGESIYGTKGTQWGQPEWGRITHKILPDGTTRMYLHVFEWPEDGRLVLDTVRRRPIQAYAMRSIPRKNYNVEIEENSTIVVMVDGGAWDPANSVVVLDVDKAR